MSVDAITKADFQKALDAYRVWDLGNDVLYKLCRDYPNHDVAEHIVAKTWLIGRAYAASLERRSGFDIESDAFYVERVVPIFQNAKLDEKLESRFTLRHKREKASSLALHKVLVDALRKASEEGEAKRSFVSKYLHFHSPEHFFIYDNYAAASIWRLTGRLDRRNKRLSNYEKCDPDYADFFDRCERLCSELDSIIGRCPTPRELDKFLLFHRCPPGGATKPPGSTGDLL